jgi:Fur family ferric uptake transcriptional regulator
MPSAGKSEAKQQVIKFLGSKRLRLTSQRRAIINCVFDTPEHFTAEQLLVWARARDKSVSRATVYRSLLLLTESGFVREVNFGTDQKYYDSNYADRPSHSHLICEDCGQIIEFDSEKLLQLESEISRQLGFEVKTHRLQLTGSCEEYRKHGVCSKKKAGA